MPPDVDTLQLLHDTLSPDPAIVCRAEVALHQRDLHPRFLSSLFEIAVAAGTQPSHLSVSHAASIYFKNLVRRSWQPVLSFSRPASPTQQPLHQLAPASLPPQRTRLPLADRQFVRARLVPALAVVPPRVRAQLLDALKRIISADFPLRFTALVPQIEAGLLSRDVAQTHAALVALRALAKVYEFKGAALVSRVAAADGVAVAVAAAAGALCFSRGFGGDGGGGDGGRGCGEEGEGEAEADVVVSGGTFWAAEAEARDGRANAEEEGAALAAAEFGGAASHAAGGTAAAAAGSAVAGSCASAAPDWGYLDANPRAALNHLVSLTFPHLLRIIRALDTIDRDPLAPACDTPFELQRTVCKIFWSFTQYDLPTYLVDDLDGVFSQWMEVFLAILRRPMPRAVVSRRRPHDGVCVPLSEEELRCLPQWKLNQWVAHIVYRLFQRYSNPMRLNPILLRSFDAGTLTRFADFFRTRFAVGFTHAMLALLSDNVGFISPRVANLALLYLETAVTTGLTYRVIRHALQPLITHVVFPYLCISDADLEAWTDDPVEYVRKSYDVLEDFNTPRSAACSLLFMMAKRRSAAVIPSLTAFFMSVLEEYADAQRLGLQRHDLARRKDGALLAIGTIRESLAVQPGGVRQLESLLSTHVLHEFSSDTPFLRARACWLYGQFAAAESLSVDALLPGLRGVTRCLTDAEFPVCVRAAVDIRHFLQNSVAAEAIAPNLADLLQLLFKLLDEVDSTDIVATIDQVAVGFSSRIAPFAPQLCERLVATFSRAASAGQADDEAGFAAVQCLQALASIVTSVAVTPEGDKVRLFGDMERTISQVFDRMFEENRIEYFEEALELLATFVYHSAEERGEHFRNMRRSGVSAQEALSGHRDANGGRTGGASGLYSNEVLVAAVQSDVDAGGGVISPYLWSLFPSAIYAFYDWASDYSFHYLQLVDAYLSKAPRMFVSSRDGDTTYVPLLIGMISRLWDETAINEEELVVQGSQVCGLFLQHCRRIENLSLDSEIGVLTQLAVTRLNGDIQSDGVVCALMRALAHLIYVSPVAVLEELDKTPGCVQNVFKLWTMLVAQGRLQTQYDRKVSAVAFSAILGSDWRRLPEVVRHGMPQLLLKIVTLLEGQSGVSEERRHGAESDMNDADGQPTEESCSPQPSTVASAHLSPVSDTSMSWGDGNGGDADDVDVDGEFSEVGDDRGAAERAAAITSYYSGDEDFNEEIDGVDVEDGENPMFCVAHDVDELLLFESVLRRLPNVASQQLGLALAKADAVRVDRVLARAAEMRSIPVNSTERV